MRLIKTGDLNLEADSTKAIQIKSRSQMGGDEY